MSPRAEVVGDLPPHRAGRRGPNAHPCWALADKHPGQWIRTDLSTKGYSSKRKLHPDHLISVRQGVVYVCRPAAPTLAQVIDGVAPEEWVRRMAGTA